MLLPDHVVASALLRRAIVVWAVLRAAFAVLSLMLADVFGPPSLDLALPASALVIALTAMLCVLDARRRREIVWLQNLGVPPAAVGALAAIPPTVAELAVAAFVAARG